MNANSESMLPVSLESERAALGAVLLDPEHLLTILAYASTDDFFLSSHREILRVMSALKRRQIAPDLVTVVAGLKQSGRLEPVGGPAYIAGLIDGVPDRPNVEAYAGKVHDAARARALHKAATLACSSIEQGESVDEVMGRLQETQLRLIRVNSRGPQKLFVPAPKFLAQTPEQI